MYKDGLEHIERPHLPSSPRAPSIYPWDPSPHYLSPTSRDGPNYHETQSFQADAQSVGAPVCFPDNRIREEKSKMGWGRMGFGL